MTLKPLNIFIKNLDSEGRGIGRDEKERVVFVENALPNSQVRVQITQEKKNFAFAEVLETLEKSPFEVEASCPYFTDCGGCTWQNLDYDKQVEYKEELIRNSFNKTAKMLLPENFKIHPALSLTSYRNKMEFAFGMNHKEVVLGLKKRKSHEILPVKCELCAPIVNQVIERLCALANEYSLPAFVIQGSKQTSYKGFLRHAVTRRSSNTKDFLLEIITFPMPEHNKDLYAICKQLKQEFPELTGIVHSTRRNTLPLAYGEKTIARFGKETIDEKLKINDSKLDISYSHQCFFQVNTRMAELLYSKLTDIAKNLEIKSIADIYCGVGGIGIALSKTLKDQGINGFLCGLESMPKAVEFARENAEKQGLKSEFVHADAKQLSKFLKNYGKLDCLVLDPPRAGIDKESMETLLRIKAPYLFFVSCNPASLARDINLLKDYYTIENFESFDFFPHTPHVESLLLLKRK